MDQVQKTKKPIVITKRNVPVAKLVPVEEEPRALFGCMKGTVRIIGDIIAPIDEAWDADR